MNALPVKGVMTQGHKIKACIDYVGLINRDEWLIVGWAYHPEKNGLDAKFTTGGAGETCDITLIQGARPDVCIYHGDPDLDKTPGFALVVRLKGNTKLDDSSQGTLMLKIGDEQLEHVLDRPFPVDLAKVSSPLKTFSKKQRVSIYSRIFEDADPLFISQLISQPGEENRQIYIDNAILLPGGIFINGWFDNCRGDLAGIFLLAGNRLSNNLISELSYYRRLDIIDAFDHMPVDYAAGGFAFVPLEIEDHCDQLEVITLTDDGKVTRNAISCTMLNGNEIELTQIVLGNVDIHLPELSNVFARHVDPALRGIWQRRVSMDEQSEVFEFGELPEHPKRTVIVPIYGRYDLVMYQLAQFASDPDFQETDLLYVLDDPSIRKDFLQLCENSSRIFRVSFRVVTSGRNQGFACANNLGAQYARSDVLVLMNSDVMPQQKGWLGRLQAQYQALEQPGAVGVRLVYDDGTIQHDGMAFIESPEYPSIWLNDHPNKGLPVLLADEPGVRELPAVTAALMMIGRDRYAEAGGLDPAYILGDFEDSDLCLKLLEAGYKNYLVSTEQLFHLERQSQNLVNPGDWKHKLTLYNAWQHTKRWGETINAINSNQS